MIKKILTAGIIILGLFNFINATDLTLYEIGNIGEYLQATESSPEFTVQEKGNLNSIQLGNTKNFLAFSDTNYNNVKNKKYFRWNNGKAYFYWSLTGSSYTPNLVAGEFIKYYYCDSVLTGKHVYNCSLYDYTDNLKNFFSSISTSDKFGYYVKSINQNSIDLIVCFSSNSIGKSICFDNTNIGFYNQIDMEENLSFSDFPNNLLGNSPGYGNNNYNPGEIENITGDIYEVPTDIDRYIQYYESKYGWDETVCYVGTDDLTGAYGKPGLSFQYGSGATMFSLYYLMYGTFGQTPVKNVGHFLNCWLLNYNQWWDTISDERSYLCNYIGPSEGSVLTYDVTENPFKNNRAAIYFLVDNLYNHQYRIDTSFPMFESSMGDEFAFYCAAKLNYENYKNGTLDFSELENQIDPILKDIIGDWNNRNLGSQYGFSVPNMSGDDNIWGNLIQTGSGIPDDLNPSGLFKQFYDRINSLLQNFSPRTAFGFIPLWILYPMLFLILFRILRH